MRRSRPRLLRSMRLRSSNLCRILETALAADERSALRVVPNARAQTMIGCVVLHPSSLSPLLVAAMIIRYAWRARGARRRTTSLSGPASERGSCAVDSFAHEFGVRQV